LDQKTEIVRGFIISGILAGSRATPMPTKKVPSKGTAAPPGRRARTSFPIVGVGASAGGLKVLTVLLKELPAHSGMGFVLIQHLDPQHESALTHILSTATSMPVHEVSDGMAVLPDHVYVIPPDRSMILRGGALKLTARDRRAPHHPIDEFFTSLAEEQKIASIGIILSGSGSDGTRGLQAIKAVGGFTFAQDPETAEWPAMPSNAITASAVDFALSPKRIAAKLKRIARHPCLPDRYHAPVGKRLLRVGGFFRNPQCFDALRKRVFPKLRNAGSAKGPTRVWVPACSTGEECYSIAMLLLEAWGMDAGRTKIQMFGTDISEPAIEEARAGIYSKSALRGVSAARLKRFFVKCDGGYRVHKAVRDLCVFARHDIARDPPFSRLDLISCREILIDMESASQERTLAIFQYALRPGKFLLLGTADSAGACSDTFAALDARHGIFSRKIGPMLASGFEWRPSSIVADTLPISSTVLQREIQQVLLRRYAPAALVVDSDLNVVHFQGDTARYLVLAGGPPVFHVLKMVRPEFLAELRGALAKAAKGAITVASEVITIEHNGQAGMARVEVSPLRRPAGENPNLLVVFREITPRGLPRPRGARTASRQQDSQLGRELASTQEYLRSLIAEHEAVQEEMKAAGEESLSNNEELQCANEELETAKEELQASNQELTTLNDELRRRNAELDVLGSDLANLLVGVQIPVLVLDGRLHIRRFTPLAGKLLNLIESDVGRPFRDIAASLSLRDWDACFLEVINHARTVEREVKDRHGYWYALRLHPYRTRDNRIDGVIVVLLDIDLIKRPLLEEARASRDYASVLLESSGQAVIAVGLDERIVLINTGVEKMFGYRRDEIVGQPLRLLLPESARQHPSQHLREFLDASANQPEGLGLSLDACRKDGSLFPVEVNLSMIQRTERRLAVAFVADITERRRLEKMSEIYRAQIGALAAQLITAQEEERRRVSRELHDGLCQRLASLALDVDGLATQITPAAARTRLRALQTRVIQASEEARHIAYELHPSMLDDLGLVISLKALCDEFSKTETIAVRFTASKLPDSVPQEVASGLYRIAQESLQNVAKHSRAKHVAVELTVPERSIRLSIKDDGVGFDPVTVKGKGGLGMVGMGERARMMRGRLSMESRPGHGAEIAVRVPMEWAG
jgi:two-component system, chemotaxis family, CheB/CheR fusion protein